MHEYDADDLEQHNDRQDKLIFQLSHLTNKLTVLCDSLEERLTDLESKVLLMSGVAATKDDNDWRLN